MSLKWTDSRDIAIELNECYPAIDPTKIRFTDLREWIMALDEFDDDPNHCSERVLEAVQMLWIEEAE
jgi:FeS assembly protein IscX